MIISNLINEHFVRLRPAELTDIPELLKIEKSCFANERFDFHMLEDIISGEGFECFIGSEENNVIASAMVHHEIELGRSRIVSIAVLPKMRGKGLGRTLLKLLEERSIASGSSIMGLEVRVTNVPAINLYLHDGYEVCGTIPNYFGRGQDALYMERRLI
jgi:ribosomal protein S18 acetylase RimI-like enzyme